MPPRDWKLRVEDILASIRRISEYTAGMDYGTFSRDTLVADAVMRHFLVIGEAARHVPADLRARYPQLPWSDMQDMRNLLVHEYFGADLQTIWDTVRHDLPPLVPELQRILDEDL